MVESANARIKKWKYLNNVLPTNQVPFIGDYVRIVCTISNKFAPPLARTTTDDEHLAAKMRYLSHQKNHLQQYVLENGLDRRSVIWKPIDDLEGFSSIE